MITTTSSHSSDIMSNLDPTSAVTQDGFEFIFEFDIPYRIDCSQVLPLGLLLPEMVESFESYQKCFDSHGENLFGIFLSVSD